MTNITKVSGKNRFRIDVAGERWAGIGPNGEAAGTHSLYYSRIPAMTITDDNSIVAMFDLRWNGAYDQDRIDPGVAISSDGGHSWEKKTAWLFNKGGHPRRRAMDATILYNPIDNSLYAMHGTWAGGSENWYRDRHTYFNHNLWAATIHKSTDGGITWEKSIEFSKTSNAEIFSKVQKGEGNPTISFLGGVGSGIVMRDGTLVFPIQTSHLDGIATTIMYSKDNGKTWDMPKNNNALAPNPSSLENMVFEIEPGKLVMTGREDNHSKARWAYYSDDLGKSWQPYEAVNKFSTTLAAPSQGSSIYVTLPNGRRVLLVSKPDGLTRNDKYQRGNLSLWMLDAKNPAHKFKLGVIRPGLGNADGAGYSSLAYKEGNLFVAFEDDGDIRVKNISEYMDTIQSKALEWNLPDEIEPEVAQINALSHLNRGQKDKLIEKMRKANDFAISQSIAIDKAMKDLKTNSRAFNEQVKQLTKALPSQLRLFSEALNQVNHLTQSDNLTYLDYNTIVNLEQSLKAKLLEVANTKLDFSQYVKRAEKLNEYNTDILYRSFDNVFAHYDTGTKHNKLSVGVNSALNANFKAGLFFEYKNKNINSYQLGLRTKYQDNNNVISSFIRYRTVKHPHFAERNKNIDGYLNYAYQIPLENKLIISPAIGFYLSHSSRTLLDEDVAVNKRNVYAGDVGLNIHYQLNDINVSIQPNIALVKNNAQLSQSNDETNTYRLDNKRHFVYAIRAGIEKQWQNGLSLGATLKLQKYGSKYSETNIGVNASYNW